jgi:heat shock protein HtpX
MVDTAVLTQGAVAEPRLRGTDFLSAQRANHRNTVWLIVILLTIGAVMGYLLGWTGEAFSRTSNGQDVIFLTRFVAWMLTSTDRQPVLQEPVDDAGAFLLLSPIGIIAGGGLVTIGLLAMAATFQFGHRIIASVTEAHDTSADDEPMLHNVVEEMAVAAGLPKPRVMVIETDVPNAFAAGMDPSRSVIGVTRGLLRRFTRDELQAVVGHETAHILNGDNQYMTAVAVMVGLIILLADGVRAMGRSAARSHRGAGAALLLLPLVIVCGVFVPFAAQAVRFAVSRQREYLADATAVQLTRNPVAAISALERLAGLQQPFPGASRATQHMFIVNPLKAFDLDSSGLLSTHPPIELRIERLRNLGNM